MFKNILIAFDGSAHSVQAATFAAGVAGAVSGVRCTLIAVLTFSRDEALFLGASEPEYSQAEVSFKKKHFGKIEKFFDGLGLDLVTVVKEGNPAVEILKYATENGIDHIVIGTRGLGNIQGALLGSVSSRVVHSSPCPVTLVKDRSAQKGAVSKI
ncbi:MAG: hypothetical protein JL50_03490 [Peptococcaceae bacterium BICA1-7]|nr:MAG: hypothetical protein JL50_03490 [Peptococcaceae bacterium BICA1-7]HBV97671.1 universal stress protein [Desulfotomaculum sp.]